MLHEEIRDDADLHFTGKTDAQILRELYAFRGRRLVVLPDEQSEHQNTMAAIPDDEIEGQIH